MKGTRDYWTEGEVAELLRLFGAGVDYVDMAEFFGRSKNRTAKKVRELRKEGRTDVYRDNQGRNYRREAE